MPARPPQSASPPAFIALGTCNGARFLCEFAASVRNQSYTDWRMLVRDDASSDATVAQLREIAHEEKRWVVLREAPARSGPAKNFATLLQSACDLGAEYVFLADQDDVWLPDKIARQMDLIRRAEAAAPSGTSILVYSDLAVVDARLRTIHRSFFRHAGLYRHRRQPLKTLLAHNFVPGCSVLMNRPLLELAVPFPSSIPVHDWWIALCAAATGQLAFLAEPTVLYRQHGGNAVGACGLWEAFNPWQRGLKDRWRRGKEDFARHVEQTRALRRRLQERDSPCRPQTWNLLDRYCRLLETPASGLRRVDGMHRLGIPETGLLRRLLFYARLLTVNRQTPSRLRC